MNGDEDNHVLMDEIRIFASGQVFRSGPVHIGMARAVRLLLKVEKIGSPSSGESVTVRPVFYDERSREYLDADTTYGTFSVTGAAAPTNISKTVPFPVPEMGIMVTGAGSLALGTEIVVSARYVSNKYSGMDR